MRVLMVHNRYLQRGGEDVSTEQEVALLKDAGHDVTLYEEDNERIASLGPVRTSLRTVWSPETRTRIGALLATEPFDVVHVQNFFPLVSPSVYYAAARHSVPIVQALRNFRLLCPAATLEREGRVCELCPGRAVAWPAIRHSCYHDSLAGSATVAAMSSLHRFAGTWRRVNAYVTPSQFAKSRFTAAGWDADRITVKPNFVHPDPGPGDGAAGYALFVGRLAREKGLGTLLEAWKRTDTTRSLRIVGDGPERAAVERLAATDARVELLGRLDLDATYRQMGAAALVIVPSGLYETFGRVVVEAFAMGTPVIVSQMGGLTELVDEEVTGRSFPAGDVAALAERIRWMLSAADLTAMRAAARLVYEVKYTGEANLPLLEQIYRSVSASV